MKILIMGSGHLAESVYKGFINKEIDVYVLTEDKKLINIIRNKDYIVKSIEEIKTLDLIILAGYGPIIQLDTIKRYNIINIHGSLLPKYRGMHSTVWAMLNGDNEVGYTVHKLDELVDNGDIIYQYKTFVENKTSQDIIREFDVHIENNICELVKLYLNNKITLIKQDYSQATFVAKRNREDCKINWNWNTDFIKRFFNALVEPYPLPYFIFKENEYEIIRCELIERNYYEIPGHVLYKDYESVWIKVNNGLMRLYEVRSNNKIIKAVDLFKTTGYRLK